MNRIACFILLMSVFSLVYGEGVHELSDTIINDNSTSRTEIHLLEDRLAPKSGPKSVSIGITINKIYKVHEADQTYSIDGYLVAKWQDSEARKIVSEKISHVGETINLQDSQIDYYQNKGLWLPNIEFINVIGKRTVPNRRVTVSAAGDVMYNDRFDATFTTAMDFRKFPFDQQSFLIEIESFSKSVSSLVFTKDNDMVREEGSYFNLEWNKPTVTEYTKVYEYPHLEEKKFSRYTLEITTTRVPNYYLWQFVFPLFLIILASWCVFWIDNFDSQLGTSFTLMLTVVAFAFYTTNILPKLPYTSFLNALVIVGYLSIFVGILVVLAHHKWLSNTSKSNVLVLFFYRLGVPSLVIISITYLSYSYFWLV